MSFNLSSLFVLWKSNSIPLFLPNAKLPKCHTANLQFAIWYFGEQEIPTIT